MATRLYVDTDRLSDAFIEDLFLVSHGTMQRLRNLRPVKAYTRKGVDYYLPPGSNTPVPLKGIFDLGELMTQEFEAIQTSSDLMDLYRYLSYGFGSMCMANRVLLRERGFLEDQLAAGHTSDPELMAHLLYRQLDEEWQAPFSVFYRSGIPVAAGPHIGEVPVARLGSVSWC